MTGSSESQSQLLYWPRLQDCLAGHSYVATKIRTWREKKNSLCTLPSDQTSLARLGLFGLATVSPLRANPSKHPPRHTLHSPSVQKLKDQLAAENRCQA